MDANSGNGGNQTVLLSGASGMLGTAVRTSLERDGISTMRLVRRAPAEINELHWDPHASRPIHETEALEGIAAAIHLSGANVGERHWTAAYKREMTASRVESTYAVATALAGLQNPPRTLLVASAAGIYGNRGDENLTEDSAPGKGFLAELCQMWEEAAQSAVQAGIRVVHLRFGVVLAPGGGALAKMLPAFRMGLGGKLGSGRQWMSWVALDDAVTAIRFLLEHNEIAGPVNIVSPQPVTNAEFTRALGAALHRPAAFPVPAFALRLAFGQMADEALLASTRVLPKKLEAVGFRFALPELNEAFRVVLR